MRRLMTVLGVIAVMVAACGTVSPTPTATIAPSQTPPEGTIKAIYQRFERGFMVWRGSKNCVYAFNETTGEKGHIIIPAESIMPGDMGGSYRYCIATEQLPAPANVTPAPDGLYMPVGVIGQVWSAYTILQTRLGYAVEAETAYDVPIPKTPPNRIPEGPFTLPEITLPDGRVLWCGYRAATSGTCTV